MTFGRLFAALDFATFLPSPFLNLSCILLSLAEDEVTFDFGSLRQLTRTSNCQPSEHAALAELPFNDLRITLLRYSAVLLES